jgi:hypothetical protein
MSGRCRGSSNGNATLTEDDVVLIRACAEERARLNAQIVEHEAELARVREEKRRISNRRLSEKFGVHHRVIESIVYGSAWAHVP